MNDFFLANNDTQSFEIDKDYSIDVRQVLVHEINLTERFAGPIREALKEKWAIGDLHEIINKNQVACITLTAYLTTLTAENTVKIKDSAPEKFIEIFEMLIKVNQEYFKKNKDKKQKQDSESTWFDSFQYLIANGHRHSDILNYSFGAFIAYVKAVQKSELATMSRNAATMRVAYHADKKAFDKFNEKLKADHISR